MNIIPKEFRKLQEFQHVEIPSTKALYQRAKGLSIPRQSDSVTADFNSRKIDQLSESVYEVGQMLRDSQMPIDIDTSSSVSNESNS